MTELSISMFRLLYLSDRKPEGMMNKVATKLPPKSTTPICAESAISCFRNSGKSGEINPLEREVDTLIMNNILRLRLILDKYYSNKERRRHS